MVISLKHKKQTYCRHVCKAWCCRNLIMFYNQDEKDIQLFFNLRNIKWDKEHHQIVVPCRCNWIMNNNKCRNYPFRPDSCKVYECEKLKSMTIDN